MGGTTAAALELEFEAKSHVYRINGQPIPSVTQVLEDVGIIDYSYIPGNTREMALDRGRDVHLATAFDDEGDLDEAGFPFMPYVQAWRNFRAATGFEPDAIEQRGFNRDHNFAGTIDRLGRMGDGTVAIIDLKCGQAQKWVALQIGAYCSFLPDPRVYRRLCVELHPNETFSVFEFKSSLWKHDFNLFLTALTVYRMKRELGDACRK